MNKLRNPTSPWRFYAAADKDQLITGETFHYILLTGSASAAELLAVLNSTLVNELGIPAATIRGLSTYNN